MYATNKKMKFQTDKLKKVLKLKSTTYYNYLDEMNKDMMKRKKKNIKDKRDSVLKTNENNFVIRELPDGPGSNYSSVKKESNIKDDDLPSEMQISMKEGPLKIQDFLDLEKSTVGIGEVLKSLKDYFAFEMSANEIIDIMASSKNSLDEKYHDYSMKYKKCLSFGKDGPTLIDAAKEEYNWAKLKKDSQEIKLVADTNYERIQLLIKKKKDFKTVKREYIGFDENILLDFLFVKYKMKAGGGSGNKEEDMFDSNIKEQKSEKNKDFDFDIDEMEDAFDQTGKEEKKETTTFALDQENDAFADFNSKKKSVSSKFF